MKKPDEFITLSHRAWQWVRNHATRVIAMLSVALVIVAAAWAWGYYAEKRAKKATAALTEALDIYNRGVIEGQGAPPAADDKSPRFKTREAKLEAANKAFTKISKEQAGNEIGLTAVLMRGSIRFEQDDFAGAEKDYRAFLSEAGRTHRFRAQAIEGLIYSLEARKKWDAALKAVARLPRQGDKRFPALYHEARILMAKGDRKGAIKRYREIVEQSSTRFLVKHAEQWLAALEDGA